MDIELTKEQIDAFERLNESYIHMHEQQQKQAPRCHFTPMHYQEADYEAWWECPHCGHTKEIGMLGRPL